MKPVQLSCTGVTSVNTNFCLYSTDQRSCSSSGFSQGIISVTYARSQWELLALLDEGKSSEGHLVVRKGTWRKAALLVTWWKWAQQLIWTSPGVVLWMVGPAIGPQCLVIVRVSSGTSTHGVVQVMHLTGEGSACSVYRWQIPFRAFTPLLGQYVAIGTCVWEQENGQVPIPLGLFQPADAK